MNSKIQMKGLQFNKEAVTKLNDDQLNQVKGGIGGGSSKGASCSCCSNSCNTKLAAG